VDSTAVVKKVRRRKAPDLHGTFRIRWVEELKMETGTMKWGEEKTATGLVR
jgi:hypothetical protein